MVAKTKNAPGVYIHPGVLCLKRINYSEKQIRTNLVIRNSSDMFCLVTRTGICSALQGFRRGSGGALLRTHSTKHAERVRAVFDECTGRQNKRTLTLECQAYGNQPRLTSFPRGRARLRFEPNSRERWKNKPFRYNAWQEKYEVARVGSIPKYGSPKKKKKPNPSSD